ncbi:uncharacterized protein LOC108911590 [Anoplophora glabripennis]|uniref:uncharacterized protein LOC108911590 n=1 Tax=Anoplophora glabripennis TaxID=217634 RepID=UPI0008734E47|nr:uncharacterized protein LOC108911590 [Anoplophora glabripennis]
MTLMTPYYDPVSKSPFRITAIANLITNSSMKVQSGTKNNGNQRLKIKMRRFTFRSNGCNCLQLNCGCCLGINLSQFNFNREGCMNFTYDPYDFSVTSTMSMNENTIFSNTFSAKNPPPLCIPVPIPYIPIQIETCARIYNVYTPGQNLHMCFDFETRIQKATLFILHFDCIRMGLDGVALLKPDDMGGLSTSTEYLIDSDIYDEVTEIKFKS